MSEIEGKILQELKRIKKELQDIRSILEPKKIKILINSDEIVNPIVNADD